MVKLYVNNVKVGGYDCFLSEFSVKLEQKIDVDENSRIYQLGYYFINFPDFIALYFYQDTENDIEQCYLIDTRVIDIKSGSYDAIKVDSKLDWDKLFIKLILESSI